MLKRIFTAFALPKATISGLKTCRDSSLPVVWTRPENLHVTLNFLGEQAEENLSEIFRIVESVASQFPPFTLKLVQARVNRKMIWATFAPSSELFEIQNALSKNFAAAGFLSSQNSHNFFNPHVCLARSKMALNETLYPARPLQLKFPATHIVIFWSILKPDYPRYISLDAFELTG